MEFFISLLWKTKGRQQHVAVSVCKPAKNLRKAYVSILSKLASQCFWIIFLCNLFLFFRSLGKEQVEMKSSSLKMKMYVW